MEIKFKKLHPNTVLPKLATPGSACVDLVATEVITEGLGKVTIKFGFATEIPQGYKICIAPRSSFSHKGWVLGNHLGIIDCDYRGEWMAKFQSIPTRYDDSYGIKMLMPEDFPYKVGDRVAQCWLEEVIALNFVEAEELNDTVRGTGGFGSTGK